MTATPREAMAVQKGPMQAAIEAKLDDAFAPLAMQVINESSLHSVPPGSETHFKVVIVSAEFADRNLVARHRAVNAALAAEMAAGIHALSIEARTPQEWQQSGGRIGASPKCLGGSKAEAR